MRALMRATISQDYITWGLRWVSLVAFVAIVFLARGQYVPLQLEKLKDLLPPLAIGAGANLLLGIVITLPPLRPYTPFVLIAGDWATAFAFTRVLPDETLLLASVLGVLLLNGMLRLGSGWGTAHAVGTALSALVSLLSVNAIDFNRPFDMLQQYGTLYALLLLLGFLTFVWSNALDEDKTHKARRTRQAIEENLVRLNNMRERVKAISDMATMLNTTLNISKILDAAMDIGRFALRENPKQRLISLALLVEDEDTLRMESARGLQHVDEHKRFRGQAGILGEAFAQGEPIIWAKGGENDPELGNLKAFANIQSVLVIPLRAGFETYGALVYASTAVDAFNADHIDTLRTLGIQTTIALQNAALFKNLQEEKERLLAIEDNARKALVRDLHDLPTQTISAVAMQLPVLVAVAQKQPDKLKEEVGRLRDMTMRAVEEIRHVMFALRPLSLEAQGLGIALQQLAEKMDKTYKQAMQVEVDPNAEHYLKQEQQGSLFYLIEEAANNARKYAEASLIRVRVALEGSAVVVRVQDNGKGFDVNATQAGYEQRSSFGMVNMRERAELAGGKFELHSAPNKGTLITVTIPVDLKSRAPQQPPPKSSGKTSLADIKPNHRGPISPSR